MVKSSQRCSRPSPADRATGTSTTEDFDSWEDRLSDEVFALTKWLKMSWSVAKIGLCHLTVPLYYFIIFMYLCLQACLGIRF